MIVRTRHGQLAEVGKILDAVGRARASAVSQEGCKRDLQGTQVQVGRGGDDHVWVNKARTCGERTSRTWSDRARVAGWSRGDHGQQEGLNREVGQPGRD